MIALNPDCLLPFGFWLILQWCLLCHHQYPQVPMEGFMALI